MFGLSAFPLPLETLPGWPAAPDPSMVEVLFILLGVPALVAAVPTVLTLAPLWFRRSQGASKDVAVKN